MGKQISEIGGIANVVGDALRTRLTPNLIKLTTNKIVTVKEKK